MTLRTIDRPHAQSQCALHQVSADSTELSWTQRRVHAAIVWYQRAREGRPSPCRFFPTCSSYALEAYDTHGVVRGTWLTGRRLARCRPLGPSGIDLVPAPARPSGDEAADCSCSHSPERQPTDV